MIRPLRQFHRRIIPLLAIALVALFIAGLLVRQSVPPASHLPETWLAPGGARP